MDGIVERTRLTLHAWQEERAELRRRVRRWTTERVERGLRGDKHPVYDFLFEYYSYRPAHLERYSPGLGVTLDGAKLADLEWERFYTVDDAGATILPGPALRKRLPKVRWVVRFLRTTLDRLPQFHCFGLHEWAMVYKTDEVRHRHTALRLTPGEIASFVESQRLACTHFDAFRFFTPDAVPLNRHRLTRPAVSDHDQPGCIHANMDLYKWAFHAAPMTSSRITVDAFELAREAREIDMRASPYDLTALGFAPIRIETKAGREEYVSYQRLLFERSQPIRSRLLAEYEEIERELESSASEFANSWSSRFSV